MFIRRETGEVLPRFHVGSAQRRAAMKVVAALIKDGQVIDTCTLDVPTRDDLAEMAKKAFAHFHDRYPHLTTTADDVIIAFRDDDRSHESGDRQ